MQLQQNQKATDAEKDDLQNFLATLVPDAKADRVGAFKM